MSRRSIPSPTVGFGLVALLAATGCIGEAFSAGGAETDGDPDASVAAPSDETTPDEPGSVVDPVCDDPAAPGCVAPCDDASCEVAKSCAAIHDRHPELPSGLYAITPFAGSPAIEVACDMETGGLGWTRVARFTLGAPCVLGEEATTEDPTADASGCAKYDDALINRLASSRLFYTTIGDRPPLFTRYAGTLSALGAPISVAQSDDLTDLVATVTYTPVTYGYWKLFHQQDFYGPDGCMGAPAESARLSMEYASGSGSSYVYAVTGDCASLGASIMTGTADVYVR